jgi:hypothetical protein
MNSRACTAFEITAITLLGLVSMILGCRCGHAEIADESELKPTETNGVLTIQYPNRPDGGHAWVRVSETPTLDWSWFAMRFPARVSVPFDTRVVIVVRESGFDRFQHEYNVTRDNPRRDVIITLEESRGYCGYKPSELPKETGLRPVIPPRKGHPETLFVYQGYMRLGRPEPISPVMDDQGQVWRELPSGAGDGGGDRWVVATIDPNVLRRMNGLVAEAGNAELTALGSRCNDCGTSGILVRRPGADGRGPDVILCSDGSVLNRRTNPAADVLLRWILAVLRDAPNVPQ